MAVEGATFATWHPNYYLTGYSWDAVAAACLMCPHVPTSILMLGLAGGTVARQLRLLLPTVQITAVEIDPDLVELAQRYMGLEQLQVKVEVADAYVWLKACSSTFDVVVDDVYLSGRVDVERPFAPTGDTLNLLDAHTEPFGIVVANMITDGLHKETYKKTRSAFKNRFASVAEAPSPKGYNQILVGGKTLANPSILDDFTCRFPRQRDRNWWRRIQISE